MSEDTLREFPERESSPTALVYSLTCTPDLALCFAARTDGLLISVDGGHTWEPAYAGLDLDGPLPTTSLVFSPDLTRERTLIAGVSGGVVYSIDGGKTWQPVALASPPPTVSALVISPNFIADGIVLAGTMEDGVFRSTDRGSRWSAWNFGLLDLNVLCLAISPDFARDETLYAGVDTGIFRSTNGGRAWREVELPFGYDPVLSLKLAPDYAQDADDAGGVIFAGTESQGLWRSTDRGQTWNRVGADVISGPVNAIVLAPEFGMPMRRSTRKIARSLLVMADDTLYFSHDGGETWEADSITLAGMTAVAAPQGFAAPLLVGLENGEIIYVMPPLQQEQSERR